MAAPRLTEEDVHAECAKIAAQGERPTALILHNRLGCGSLTTITKFLTSWNATEQAQTIKIEALPVVAKLPPELAKDSEDLVKKVWNTAKAISDAELEIQREALKQAEIINQAKVEEAYMFSEAQSVKIEQMTDALFAMKEDINRVHKDYIEARDNLIHSEKVNVGVSKDNEQLRHEISELKNQILSLEELNKSATQEKTALEKEHATVLKQKESENRSLDMQVHKLQTSLDVTVKSNDELKSDIKSKSTNLSDRIIELEKLAVRYQAVESELKTLKDELKMANNAATEAGKLVANLEGQLKVYKTLDKADKSKKSAPEQ